MPDELSDDSAPVPIRIHPQGDLPIHLQIRHQLSYLISSERLPSGARLPAVRTLAEDLDVSPHTVAKAYQSLQADGLIDSRAGRGSFVRDFGGADAATARRSALLTEALRAARTRARALGFSDAEALRRLSTLVSQEPGPAPVVFVDAFEHIAEKYARRLEHHLPGTLRATGLTPEAIADGRPNAVHALDAAYYVLAFARTIPAVERLLPGDRHDITTISSEVTPDTVATLRRLPAHLHAAILTEERYIHASLNLLATYSALDASAVAVHTPDDLDAFVREANGCDMAFYTFSVRTLIARQNLDVPTRELAFDVSHESLEKLRRLLNPAAHLAPA